VEANATEARRTPRVGNLDTVFDPGREALDEHQRSGVGIGGGVQARAWNARGDGGTWSGVGSDGWGW